MVEIEYAAVRDWVHTTMLMVVPAPSGWVGCSSVLSDRARHPVLPFRHLTLPLLPGHRQALFECRNFHKTLHYRQLADDIWGIA